MSITVVQDEDHGIEYRLVISASGVPLHLSSTLETKDEIWLLIEPDEPGWQAWRLHKNCTI